MLHVLVALYVFMSVTQDTAARGVYCSRRRWYLGNKLFAKTPLRGDVFRHNSHKRVELLDTTFTRETERDFVESGLLENEATAPAQQAHTTQRQ